ncbi:phosphoglucomutase/phosphomannomutase family protein [Acidipila sp. EB88]|uniref:phosphoglucomutase/phosphomannomutase family protein n=1 Tax=Acidipila sp. EB88 TaxID=2305226 RepID=UPI000F5E011E|nr:phosphoglucomutase/phosphomannomutase family protein [Acidipila sp. EB88]RRA47355.1 phosphoglucomutase/phosphomannomutase family protein [Acidipila sp. EB88]
MGAEQIKFGTDGWRGIIAADFTFENVRIAAAAIGNYLLLESAQQKGAAIGYDSRFGSRAFAEAVAEVLADAGIPVALADNITPTPALSFGVRAGKHAGGVMITSSHNPFQWNGVKYKAYYGGSGRPAIIAEIEKELGKPIASAATPAKIEHVDFNTPYIQAICDFANLEAIKTSGLKFGVDCMYGAGRGVLAGIFTKLGVDFVEIRGENNPLFPGINPEPIEPHIRALGTAVVEHKCDSGFATDGDADRIGAIDEHGNFVDPHKIFAILLEWLLTTKDWAGGITRAFNTTGMLDRIAARYNRPLYEHGIGFKYVVDLMLEKEILIGGEESGGIGIQRHLPERDGLLNALLLATVMSEQKKTLGELVQALQDQYGEHQYGRIDLHINDDLKNATIAKAKAGIKEIGGMEVERVATLDGIKLFVKNPEAASKPNAAESWLLLRASGTEPLLRIYSESCSKESVEKLLEAGRQFALTSLD